MTPPNPWLITANPVARPLLRMFCFPHAGGGASMFRSWSEALPVSVEVCGVQLPGRESRWKEAPVPDARRLVDRLLPAIEPSLDIPYVLYGHSMGSLLAFELADELRRRGRRQPLHLLVSSRCAPHLTALHPPISALDDAGFAAAIIRQYDGIPKVVHQDPELLRIFLPALRSDMTVMESYRWREAAPLDCPISAFAGLDDRSVTFEQLVSWRQLTCRDFRLEMLPGDHFLPQNRRDALLRSISRDLAPLIAQGL